MPASIGHRFPWRLLWLGLIVVLGIPAMAAADEATANEADPAAAAEALKREGDALMVERRYTEALQKYDQAYAKQKNAALLYNRARAYESLGQYHLALEQLEGFIEQASPELKARVPKLDELHSQIESRVTTLTVRSNVAGARVLVNERLIGETPIVRQRVSSGSAVIEVFRDGFAPRKDRHTLPGGKDYEIEVALASAARKMGVLRVTSSVVGAKAFVDGQPIGTVPAEAPVDAGAHQVLVTHPDYEDYEAQVVVRAGETQTKEAPLEEKAPLYAQWWLWTIVGTVAVGGAIAGGVYAAITERPADRGDIPPGQVQAPLVGASVPIVRW